MDSEVSKSRQVVVAVFFVSVAAVIAAIAYWLVQA